MKFVNVFRMLVATCALAVSAHASAAPILLVDNNGILTGATGVDIGSTLYNVTFVNGAESCVSLFNGCVQSAFTFHDKLSAQRAAQSLLDQVFINSSAGQFDSQPSKTFNCNPVQTFCQTWIFYSVDTNYALAVGTLNRIDGQIDSVTTNINRVKSGGSGLGVNYAIFQLASPAATVPEPTSIALFGLAMAGLAFNRRRKA